jgi:hypothetical protein
VNISVQFRQTLISTGVVGSLFGLFCALASFGFYSEYGPNISSAPHTVAGNIASAIGTFFLVAVGIVFVFGILPTAFSYALHRFFGKND